MCLCARGEGRESELEWRSGWKEEPVINIFNILCNFSLVLLYVNVLTSFFF